MWMVPDHGIFKLSVSFNKEANSTSKLKFFAQTVASHVRHLYVWCRYSATLKEFSNLSQVNLEKNQTQHTVLIMKMNIRTENYRLPCSKFNWLAYLQLSENTQSPAFLPSALQPISGHMDQLQQLVNIAADNDQAKTVILINNSPVISSFHPYYTWPQCKAYTRINW